MILVSHKTFVMKLNKLFWKILFSGAVILLFSQVLSAQDTSESHGFSPTWQIKFHGGTSIFFGDIKQNPVWPLSSDHNEWSFAGGLNLEYQISPVFAVGIQGLYGQLSGTKKKYDVYFVNNYYESNLFTNINFNNLFGSKRTTRLFSVYGLLGVGLVQFTTQLRSLTTGATIKASGEGGAGSGIKGRTLEGILIYGLGVNFRLNNSWVIQLESANRTMNSDAQDVWVSGYPYDIYNYTSLGFVYKFGTRNKKKKEEEVTPAGEEPVVIPVVPVDTAVAEEVVVDTATVEEVPPVVIPADTAIEEVVVTEIPPVETITEGLNYRVQILARFTGPLTVESISSGYKIPAGDITEDVYEGHFIYTVGHFDTYEEARIKRDELRYYYGITDAFVVAYDKGKRLEHLPDE